MIRSRAGTGLDREGLLRGGAIIVAGCVDKMRRRRARMPRVLVTGFEPFPGAPVNPTAWLVERLRARPPQLPAGAAFRTECLPVDYRIVGDCLSQIARDFTPDIVVHFGLAQTADGFRLERLARNRFDSARPDNSGFCPPDGPICAGPPVLASTLPLQEIHDALIGARLPVEWSDDAGGYLCNMAMTLALSGSCGSFRPRMAGFIHVPPFSAGAEFAVGQGFDEETLLVGAQIIIGCIVRDWAASRPGSSALRDR